jgi:hypothetical protein
LLERAAAHGVTFDTLQDYLADKRWCFPAHSSTKCKQLHRVFSEWRRSSGNEPSKVKASASELLGLYGLLRHFMDTMVPNDVLLPELASFRALCEYLDTIVMAKRGIANPLQAASALQAQVARHLDLHVQAYGTRHVRPKHHWNMDLAQQWQRDKQAIADRCDMCED